ncbi:biotin carboxylase 2, chloroplastic-like [Zingiber officinale]|uniref:biotin carboxylase 2, chloroplastic-like n=1 Tax=Zingiber officinale TaxID=94328 RepID=UPI001C4CA3FF|nr:biotin carboxylase 2, chloroplastic-like [Zingiber officinale]
MDCRDCHSPDYDVPTLQDSSSLLCCDEIVVVDPDSDDIIVADIVDDDARTQESLPVVVHSPEPKLEPEPLLDDEEVIVTIPEPPGTFQHDKGLFFQPAGGIKGSQFNFNVGHVANFCKVYYPRRPSSYVAKRSRNDGRVLNEICRDEKILVANRGEISVRVIRTAHEMGIPCVAVHSTIDRDALHVRLADDAVCIGEAPSSQSYLHIQNVLSAAVSRGCTMLHPGYGLLAENARFVDMCRGHGVNFIGPNPDSIRVMGDKSTARETMKKAGVPTVPGSDGLLQSTEEAVKLAHEIGFPVMIKATAGGGGRGMRLAKEPDEFVKLLQQAKSEAAAAFGNDGVYLEKYIQNPRHIEFQVLADKYGNVVHFGERHCSIQAKAWKNVMVVMLELFDLH